MGKTGYFMVKISGFWGGVCSTFWYFWEKIWDFVGKSGILFAVFTRFCDFFEIIFGNHVAGR